MSGQDDFSTILDQVLDRRNSRTDPRIVSDCLIVIERYIEISSHENLLPFQISRGEISDALLRHGDNSSGPLPAERLNLRGDMDGETRVEDGGEAERTGGDGFGWDGQKGGACASCGGVSGSGG